MINGRGFKPHEWDLNGLPIIRIQNLNGSEEFNYFNGEFNSKILVKKGQLLFAWSGSRGTSFGPHIWNGFKGLLNYHTWKVDINETKVTNHFFFHFLKHLTKQIEEKAHGASALVHTQKREMEYIYLSLPPLLEQKAIAEVLTDMDSLITPLDKLIDKKRKIKQGTMEQLLTGEKRLSGFSEEWEVKRIEEIAEIRRGASPRPISDSKWFNSIGRGWIRISDVTSSNRYLNRTYQYLSDLGVEKSVSVNEGDLIMSICATIGVPVILNIKACIHDGFVVFKNFNDKVNTLFLYYLLKKSTKIFTESGQSGTQKNLNTSIINRFQISFPSLPEQKAIVQILSDMDDEITTLKQKRDKYKAIKEGMMQELLTGRVRLLS